MYIHTHMVPSSREGGNRAKRKKKGKKLPGQGEPTTDFPVTKKAVRYSVPSTPCPTARTYRGGGVSRSKSQGKSFIAWERYPVVVGLEF